MTLAIGIDLGGTKIEVVAMDEAAASWSGGAGRRRAKSYDGTIETIATMIEEAERELGRRGTVGVGHPGAISPATGLIRTRTRPG